MTFGIFDLTLFTFNRLFRLFFMLKVNGKNCGLYRSSLFCNKSKTDFAVHFRYLTNGQNIRKSRFLVSGQLFFYCK